jgi:hypothetical protein
MVQLILHFEAENGADVSAAVDNLRDKFSKIEKIEKATIKAEYPRLTGAEILAVLILGGELLKQSNKIAEQLQQLIIRIQAIARTIKGLRGVVSVEVDDRRVPLEKLTREDLHQITTADQD